MLNGQSEIIRLEVCRACRVMAGEDCNIKDEDCDIQNVLVEALKD